MQETYILLKRRINPYIFFLLLSILLYLPSSFFRFPFMPDEIRNLYITKNISNFYEFLIPKYLGEFYFEKPPFYFWILKLFIEIKFLNPLILAIFLNSILSFLIASLNYFFLKKYSSEEIGFYSSIILLLTPIFYGMNILVRMDILFLTFIFLSFLSFWFGSVNNKNLYIFLSSFFSFLAVFTKGGLGVFGLALNIFFAILIKDKKILIKAILVIVLTFLGIFIWLYLFSKIIPDYFSIMFFRQTINRISNPVSHREPFYFYLIYFLPVFLPWSIFLIRYFLNFRLNRIEFWEKIYLFWFISCFILLSFIRSKLIMYLVVLAIPSSALVSKIILLKRLNIKKFLIFFILILSFLNFFIPFISYDQKEYKILKFIRIANRHFNIYTIDKKTLLLNLFLDKKIEYLSREDIFKKSSVLIISKENLENAEKLIDMKDFSIFYK